MVKSRAEIQREYRQRLKQDEAKYEEYLAKARRRKEKNYVPTAELSRKEKAKRNEKNQIYLYRHRQKKQREGQVENIQNVPVENMETSGYETASSIDAPSPLVVNMPFPNRQNGPRKRISRALAKKSNELRNLKGKFESLQMKYKRNMRSIQRLKKKTSNQGIKNGNVSPSAKSAAEQVLKTKGSELVMTQIQTEEIQEITTENRAATGESHQTSFNTSQDTETPECSYQAPEMTPKSKTKRLLKDAGLTRKQQAKVKKQLILGYVIQNQIKKRRMGMKPTQIGAMRSLIGGKILSKYGLKHTINKATGLDGTFCVGHWVEGSVKKTGISEIEMVNAEKSDIGHETNMDIETNIDADNCKSGKYIVGDFVAAVYLKKWYIGKIVSCDDENEAEITFMKHSKSHYQWPTPEDKIWISCGDILTQIDEPTPTGKSKRMFQITDDVQNTIKIMTVVTTLDRLADTEDTKAAVHKLSVTNFEFIVTLVAIEHLLSALVPLSNMLQAKDCDLLHAANDTRVVMFLLQAERNDDVVWNSLFQKAVDIAGDVDVIPAAPRRYGRQQNRPNAPGNTSEFWNRNMYLPFVDHLLVKLETRLMQGHGRFCAQKLLQLKVSFDIHIHHWICLLNQIQNDFLPRESIDDVYQAFHACLDVDETIFVRECERWRMWWTDVTLAVERPAAPASLAESIIRLQAKPFTQAYDTVSPF
ncbi:hypothetical protein MAR_013824 [Mya arenaria]|uniref:Uncharacterized protein n=1 Tax=Mya arenaria TaxID=6604 RepID=A0ABY7G0Y4_MYAAR|nr:hypothetical protein MAR_013824 [Mya arenaria]